jgi:hypothetical protein
MTHPHQRFHQPHLGHQRVVDQRLIGLRPVAQMYAVGRVGIDCRDQITIQFIGQKRHRRCQQFGYGDQTLM